jgi:hypothetical protein
MRRPVVALLGWRCSRELTRTFFLMTEEGRPCATRPELVRDPSLLWLGTPATVADGPNASQVKLGFARPTSLCLRTTRIPSSRRAFIMSTGWRRPPVAWNPQVVGRRPAYLLGDSERAAPVSLGSPAMCSRPSYEFTTRRTSTRPERFSPRPALAFGSVRLVSRRATLSIDPVTLDVFRIMIRLGAR